MKRPLWYLLPAVSGWLLSRSCPPHQWTPTVWVALVPLFLFLHRCRGPWRALRGAWLAGIVYYAIILAPFRSLIWWGWANTPAEYQAGLFQQRLFLAIWHPLASLWCGAWWGLWGASVVWLAPPPNGDVKISGNHLVGGRVWLAAGLWIVLCEYARSATFFDFTWGFLGYALHPYNTLCQLAAFTGVLGLSALIVLVNAWVAHAVAASWKILREGTASPAVSQQADRPLAEAALSASVLLTAAACWGIGMLAQQPGTTETAHRSVTVAALQAGARTYTKDELASGSLDWTYTPLLESAVQQGAQLIVLPESVWLARLALDEIPVRQTLSPPVRPQQVHEFLSPRLAKTNAVVLADFEVLEQGKIYNSIVAWDATGMLGRYDKRQLTPFAEYPPSPFRYLAPANRITYTSGHGTQVFEFEGILLRRTPMVERFSEAGLGVAGDASGAPTPPAGDDGDSPARRGRLWGASGRTRNALETAAVRRSRNMRVGGFICQEVQFPFVIRRSVREGAQLLVSTGNDGIFRHPAIAAGHHVQAQFRAIETHRPLVRAMKTGISAIFDARGRFMEVSRLNEPAVLLAQVTPVEPLTLYTRWGEWLVALSAILVLGRCLILCLRQ